MLIFTLAFAAAQPLPLTETHQRNAACVAVIAILAGEQERGVDEAKSFKDIRQAGMDWIPLVGESIMQETGQPREVVALAITESAKVEQVRFADGAGSVTARARIEECMDVMYIDLGKAVIEAEMNGDAGAPSASDVWGADDPAIIERRKSELREDLDSAPRTGFCRTMIKSALDEISTREGKDSRDARAFARLIKGFDIKLASLAGDKPVAQMSSGAVEAMLAAEPDKEEAVARCIRFGEMLALGLPPE